MGNTTADDGWKWRHNEFWDAPNYLSFAVCWKRKRNNNPKQHFSSTNDHDPRIQTVVLVRMQRERDGKLWKFRWSHLIYCRYVGTFMWEMFEWKQVFNIKIVCGIRVSRYVSVSVLYGKHLTAWAIYSDNRQRQRWRRRLSNPYIAYSTHAVYARISLTHKNRATTRSRRRAHMYRRNGSKYIYVEIYGKRMYK